MNADMPFFSPSLCPEVIVALAVCGSILFLLIVLLLTVLFRMQAQPPGYHHVADGEDHA